MFEMNPTPPPTYKSGFVAVMGRPNVGKSTLVNALLGQKIAAVSPRPQTTRKRQLGILSLENAQIIFVDTPGVHFARHKLGEAMNHEALQVLQECDLILFIADLSQPPDDEDRLLAGLLAEVKRPIQRLLVLNKMDLVDADDLAGLQAQFEALLLEAETIAVSARNSQGLEELVARLRSLLPEGQPFFPEDQMTDFYEREIAADLIRASALSLLRDEVPHGIAIRIDEFTERPEGGAFIAATLFVERESHKGIVIGQGGTMLKQIGTAARREIEAMSGRRIYLQLRVKVRQNWRNDEKVLKWFGY
jgi:GTP-binding protein Era